MSTVSITVNGEEQRVAAGMSIRALVEHLGLDGGPVAVERNRAIVPRATHAAVVIEEGDVIEIVHFVGGG